jgi:hypothetical protein
MRWRVELIDVTGNKRLFCDVLRELSISVVEENGESFLVGEPFETCDTAADVHAHASRIQAIVQEVCDYVPEIEVAFSVGSVVERTADGGPRRHHFLVVSDALHLHDIGHVASLTAAPSAHLSEEERQRLVVQRQEQEYQHLRATAVSRIIPAVADDRALTVQRLLHGELTPQPLGHIADLIQDDFGALVTQLAPTNQWKRFYRSINHPTVFGEKARHIVSKVEPPPDPMTLDEARSFIRIVASRWLKSKAGFLGNA